MSSTESELVANYWDAYFSWRTGQLDNEAIATVVRSIWEEVHRDKLMDAELAQLRKLARMIEDEISALDDEVTWVA